MKIIHKSVLVSLVPLLTPLTAFAENGQQSQRVNTISATKGKTDSWRASKVMGVNVKSANGETIGNIEDIIINIASGDVVAVVISSGGFLGIDEAHSTVPLTAVRYDASAKAFKTKLSKEQLGKAPQFKGGEWPDYNEVDTEGTLRSYRNMIDGDVTERDNNAQNANESSNNAQNVTGTDNDAHSVTDPDNTAHNKKAKNNDQNIPTDQGDSDKDIQITKAIRSSIMDQDLSFNAKNIKIITRNEYVSLKGVVESDSEHQTILKIAKNHANSGKITDDLKVNDNK